MGTILGMYRNFQNIKLRDQVPIIIEETKQSLVELNHAQLDEGFNADGIELEPYAQSTIAYKKSKGQRFDVTTLKDTGAFRSKWVLEVSKTDITFNSSDSKTDGLVEKYGYNIFGLTKDSKTTYSLGIFYDRIKKHISEKTGLAFR